MEYLKLDFDLPRGEVVSRFTTKIDEVRLIHYPPLSTEILSDGKHQRAWLHTDFSISSLL